MTITIKDETASGIILHQLDLNFEIQQITVKDIITQRVLQEVDLYNKKVPEYFKGLVEPSEAENTIYGYRLKNTRLIDGEKQVFIALDAFQKNGYFILIDDSQAESLEEEVMITQNTNISFIKLTPLVGG